MTNRYQQLIGVLRWSIELGRIDILTEVSCLYQNLCSPREGHLDSIYPIFRYLNKNLGKNPGRMAYDPMYEPTDENVFKVLGRSLDEWKDFLPDAQEMITSHKNLFQQPQIYSHMLGRTWGPMPYSLGSYPSSSINT